jgi:uncharacterized integral membrane protein (TIGR00698 family)
LIAAGTSICGASAVIATNTVTNTKDEDVAYAAACVTVFGSLSMFVYPLLPVLLHLDPHVYGLWAGASIHEVAQVVAAAFQNGQTAGEFGTIAKLTRVMMLAPVVILLGWLAVRGRSSSANHGSAARAPMPWFVFGFVAMVAINSVVVIPTEVRTWIGRNNVSSIHCTRGFGAGDGRAQARGQRCSPILPWCRILAFYRCLQLGSREVDRMKDRRSHD